MSSHVASPQERPFVIVLGVDLADQESSGYAFDEATKIVSRIPRAEMHVVHVVPEPKSDEEARIAVGLLRLYVSEKAAVLGVTGPQRAGIHVRRGDAAAEIARLASDVGADMIVVGTHRHPQLKNLFVGSTAEQVMAAATCPVFVAGPRPKPQPSHVIVIEAACGDCLQRRFETEGRQWWCARHSENHHLRRHHVYSYHAELPFSDHDSEISATGTD